MLFDDQWRGRTVRKVRIAGASSAVPEGGQYRYDLNKTNPRRYQQSGDESDGYCNTHTDYLGQVNELYRMLEGSALYGGEQTKAILGYRTSFLAGEGLHVAADTTELQEWIESWLKREGLDGRMLSDAVEDTEVCGHVLWTVDDLGRVNRHPSFVGYEGYTPDFYLGSQSPLLGWMQPAWWPSFTGVRLTGIQTRMTGTTYGPWLEDPRDRFVYVRTGGHGNVARFPAPTTRLCLLIDSIKNYDRAVREARKLNNQTSRQVQAIEHTDEGDATDLQEERDHYRENPLQDGDMVITRGSFGFHHSDAGAVETLKTEAAMIVKDLSGVSGVPPHWLGYVDLLSNRATAYSLFETVAAGTHVERLSWEQGLHDLIRIAVRVLDGPPGGFTVTMPLLSFQQFAARNAALLDLHDRGLIGDADVHGQLPFRVQDADTDRRIDKRFTPRNGNRMVSRMDRITDDRGDER